MAAYPEAPPLDTYLRNLHELLISRGWTIQDEKYLDDNGHPKNSEVGWDYPASFGAVQINEIIGAPSRLTAYFEQDRHDVPFTLEIAAAGNPEGCTEHVARLYDHPLDRHQDVRADRELVSLLDKLETAARGTSALDLLTCRYFGSCGQHS